MFHNLKNFMKNMLVLNQNKIVKTPLINYNLILNKDSN